MLNERKGLRRRRRRDRIRKTKTEGMMMAGKKGETRTHKVTFGLTPEVYKRVVQAASDTGVRPTTWCAYTIGSAAMAHSEMRSKMTDQMVTLMANAIAEGEADGTLPK